MNRHLPIALALMILLTPIATPASGEQDDHDHVSELNGVRVVHAWTRATKDAVALVFMEIENDSGSTVILTGGEAEIAGNAELVGFRLNDGEEVYERLPQVPITAGRDMKLEPRGLAIRLLDLAAPLVEGDHIELAIEFDIGRIDVDAEVGDEDALEHSHAGHAH